MKTKLLLILLIIPFLTYAQVGINTTTPEGTLDVVSVNDTGIVYPRVTDVESVTSDGIADPVVGTAVYDISRDQICYLLRVDEWVCYGVDGSGNATTTVVDTSGTMMAPDESSSAGSNKSIAISPDLSIMTIFTRTDTGDKVEVFTRDGDTFRLQQVVKLDDSINATGRMRITGDNNIVISTRQKDAELDNLTKYIEKPISIVNSNGSWAISR